MEPRQLPSARPLTAHLEPHKAAVMPRAPRAAPAPQFVMNRITNPTPTNAQLIPPFRAGPDPDRDPPVTGGMYNILFDEHEEFDDQNVRRQRRLHGEALPVTLSFPFLTGTEQWKPGQVMVFYILSKDYYPLRPGRSPRASSSSGRAGGGMAIPVASGIRLRSNL